MFHTYSYSHHYKYLHHFKVMIITKMYSFVYESTHIAHVMHTFKVNRATREFLLMKRRRRKRFLFLLFSIEYIYFSCCASHTKEVHLPKIQCIANAMQQMVGPEKIFYSILLASFTVQQCTINALQAATT